MRDDDESHDGFDTAPPPGGAEDPYAAPTKVARVPDELLDELMKAKAAALDAAASDDQPTVTALAPAMQPRAAPAPARAPAPAPARAPAPSAARAPAPAPARAAASAARPAAPVPAPAGNDAASNDLSALAAAASHAVAPPRPGAPAKRAVAPDTKPVAFVPLKVPASPTAPAAPAPATSPSPIDPMLPANAAQPEAHVPFGLDDPGFGESPSSPGTGPAGASQQSGRTVPLSAALLASVIKSVEDKRAAAPAAPASPAASDVPVRKGRSLFTLALILAIGVGVFATGVAMFLDALK